MMLRAGIELDGPEFGVGFMEMDAVTLRMSWNKVGFPRLSSAQPLNNRTHNFVARLPFRDCFRDFFGRRVIFDLRITRIVGAAHNKRLFRVIISYPQ
jgi:hypothetical protein